MTQRYPLSDIPATKQLIKDFLNRSLKIKPFLDEFISKVEIEKSIQNSFMPAAKRELLSNMLKTQYLDLEINSYVNTNINLLKDSRTFTVTTGHQLNLFMGPLYTVIKIAQTIGLAKQLKSDFPGYNFVPIYWMASEDHDVEEIKPLSVFGKNFSWSTDQSGPTGDLTTEGADDLAEAVNELFSNSKNTQDLISEMKSCYASSASLAEAHRKLVHLIFPKDGVVVLDASSKELKESFKEKIKKELIESVCFQTMTDTNHLLKEKGYHVQINPRDIGLFYIRNGERHRLTKDEGAFTSAENDIKWSEQEILSELDRYPERFSPNATFRPIYQEFLLPNLITIGGAGEISYWLQLKETFRQFSVDFPLLYLRNSHMFMTQKQSSLLKDNNISIGDTTKRLDQVLSKVNAEVSGVDLQFYHNKVAEISEQLKKEFSELGNDMEKSVSSFQNQTSKNLNVLKTKALRAYKRKNEVKLRQIEKVMKALAPEQKLAERRESFLSYINHFELAELTDLFSRNSPDYTSDLNVHIY